MEKISNEKPRKVESFLSVLMEGSRRMVRTILKRINSKDKAVAEAMHMTFR